MTDQTLKARILRATQVAARQWIGGDNTQPVDRRDAYMALAAAQEALTHVKEQLQDVDFGDESAAAGNRHSHDGQESAIAVQPMREAVPVDAVRVRAHVGQNRVDHQGQGSETPQALSEVETLLKEAETWHGGNPPSMSLSAHELLTRLASALRASIAEAKDLRMSFEMASAALRASETAKQQAEQLATVRFAEWQAEARAVIELAAKLEQREAEIARLTKEKEDGAGLIHQPIPDMAGTEPRPNIHGGGLPNTPNKAVAPAFGLGLRIPPSMDSLLEMLNAQQARFAELVTLLLRIERACPCGARPESLNTHPHTGGCPVYDALTLLGYHGNPPLSEASGSAQSAAQKDSPEIARQVEQAFRAGWRREADFNAYLKAQTEQQKGQG